MSDNGAAARTGGQLRIFISYRRRDAAAYAGRLHDDLIDHFGADRVFMDIEAIEIGADFEEVIVERVGNANVLLAVVGPGWLDATDDQDRRRIALDDDYVRRELEIALGAGVTVVPVLVQGARMPDPADLPASLAAFCRRQAFEMSDRRWRGDVAELIGSLERLFGAPPVDAPDELPPGGSPAAPPDRPPERARSGARGMPLPRYRTRFVGRDDELARVRQLLQSTGFVTIFGAGGVGKSRLAVEAAGALEAGYADGASLAELAAVEEPALVVQTIASAAGADQRDRDVTRELLVEQLADRHQLLVIDNCEHLVEEVAALLEAIVRRCPSVHVLATSREALQVDGEALLHLDPLGVPEAGAAAGTSDLQHSPSVVLFSDRAALASSSFALDDGSAPVVAQIVAALDGLPLAIELAAASLRTVVLGDVVDGLSGHSSVDHGRRRTSQARQRTLWATVDWSYELLDDAEQLLLERLGVFAGSFSVHAAESVCGGGGLDGDVASLLGRLVDRSLVDPVESEERRSGRARLLYAVRDYARAKLRERAGDPTPSRLQAWASEVATQYGSAVDAGDEIPALRVLDLEHPNLIAALAGALEASDAGCAGCIATGLTPYWELRGLRAEGSKWVDAALALGVEDDALRATCLLAASRLASTAEFDRRRRLSNDALTAALSAGDDTVAAGALASLGHIAFETEQRETARTHLAAALTHAERSRDDASVALVSLRLALCEQGDGNPHERERLLGRAVGLYSKLGNRRGQLWCLAELGFAFLTDGVLDQAEPAFARGLDLARELGYPHGEAWMLDALGETASAAGRFEEAAAHFGGAHDIQRQLGDALNRGWSLAGLVRSHLRAGHLAESARWLGEFARAMTDEVEPLYEYTLLIRTASVAAVAEDAELAAQALGAMSDLDAPASLSPADLADRQTVAEWVEATLGRDAWAAVPDGGQRLRAADLAVRLIESGAAAGHWTAGVR